MTIDLESQETNEGIANVEIGTNLDKLYDKKTEYLCAGCEEIRKIGKVCRKCWPEVDSYI